MGIGSAIKSMFGIGSGGTSATTDFLSSGQMTEQEKDFYNYLAQQLKDPNRVTAAGLQLKQGQQDTLKQAQAMQASNRSINPALASRNIANIQAQANAELNQQQAIQRAQEDQALRQQVQGMLTGVRGSMEQAGAIQSQNEAAKQQRKAGLIGQLMSSGGQVGSAIATRNSTEAAAKSDKNAKKNVKSGEADIKKFLDSLTAKTYEYKDKSDGEGEFTSPMAQDIEKSKIGKKMVKEEEGEKVVEFDGHAFNAMLASQGYLNKKITDIEQVLKKLKKA